MLRTGKEHLELLRDGRVVYIGSERVDDVTRHPAFRGAAATVAAIYDMKADTANREAMSYQEDGGRHSIYFLRPRTREDLERRMLGHRMIADMTFGMFGRSPDHVASFVTGMAMKPDALPAPHAYADNLAKYYRTIRDNDTYVVYAVVAPQAVQINIFKDPPDPGLEGPRRIIAVPVFECPRKSFLHHVPGVLIISGQTQRKIVGLIRAPLQKRLVVQRAIRMV